MKDPLSTLILSIGIVITIGALIASVYFTPSPWTQRREWLRRSAISGALAATGSFFFVLAVLVSAPAANLDLFWRVLPFALVLTLVIGVLTVLGTFARVILWEKYDRLLRRLSTRSNDAPKKRQ